MKKDLKTLCEGIVSISNEQNCLITGLANDSRKIKPGDLFFAYPGTHSDGRVYMSEAIANGAAAVLYEADPSQAIIQPGKSVIPVPNLQRWLSVIASRFYNEPAKNIKVFGITGTNGKSSCSHFLAAALQTMQQSCAIVGTLGNGLFGKLEPTNLTTPDAITLQRLIAALQEQGATALAMEVSSHALAQGRVNGITFNTAIFTNLTHDHLDYHLHMAAYAQAKRSLFDMPDLKYGVINADDPYGKQWLQELQGRLDVVGYSLADTASHQLDLPMVYARHIQLTSSGITAELYTPWGDGLLHTRHLGRFNLSNLLAIVAALGLQGISLERILQSLFHLPHVPGRMEMFSHSSKPTVVVDYAHSPDALKQVLITLKELCQGKLWCIFGCGGDRDKTKRPIMGSIAEQYADHIILTDDNPRHENPRDIVMNILQGMNYPQKAVVEHDRHKAIAHALASAHSTDIILVAGKGHEAYQQFGDEQRIFSDRLTVQALLAED